MKPQKIYYIYIRQQQRIYTCPHSNQLANNHNRKLSSSPAYAAMASPRTPLNTPNQSPTTSAPKQTTNASSTAMATPDAKPPVAWKTPAVPRTLNASPAQAPWPRRPVTPPEPEQARQPASCIRDWARTLLLHQVTLLWDMQRCRSVRCMVLVLW